MKIISLLLFVVLAACQQVPAVTPKAEPISDATKLEQVKKHLQTYEFKPALEILASITSTESAEFYNASGIANDLDGQYLKAKEFYNKGLKLAAQDNIINENIRNNLAMSYILSGEYADAITQLENLVKSPYSSKKHLPKYRQNLALAYGLAGRPNSAYRSLIKDLSPNEARENLGFYKEIR